MLVGPVVHRPHPILCSRDLAPRAAGFLGPASAFITWPGHYFVGVGEVSELVERAATALAQKVHSFRCETRAQLFQGLNQTIAQEYLAHAVHMQWVTDHSKIEVSMRSRADRLAQRRPEPLCGTRAAGCSH